MKTIIIILFNLFAITSLYSQNITPELLGFEHHQLDSDQLGQVNYYLSKDSANIQKPLLVYLDGSGAFPLFQKLQAGIGSTIVIDFQRLRNDYKILLISKPGVPFIDEVESDKNGFPQYKEPEEYIETLSLDWRVQSANQIINHLVKGDQINSSQIVVLGFSEGAQVAPQLTAINAHITHLLLFGGNGLNQFFDPIISARIKASRGQISESQAQAEIDSLFQVYSEIYSNPENTKKNWYGHTYKRWASFTQKDPYKYLLELDIPIYFANGSLDENSVLSADYIRLEFIKKQKNNLTYKTYPNCDHQFNEIVFENGAFKEAIPKLNFVLQEAFEWLKKQ